MVEILRLQRERLLVQRDREYIRLIKEDHKDLKKAVLNEALLCELLDKHGTHTSFSEGWGAVSGRFSNLREFPGGLATVFPGTAVVESHFYALKYEKNSFRTSLLDLKLEGIMHSKQYNVLF